MLWSTREKVAKELLSINNVVLTPHIGSATSEARKKMSKIAAQNVIDVLQGRKCNNQINI